MISTGLVFDDWAPLADMQRFQREMNRLFQAYRTPAAGYPPMNLWHDREQALVQMEAPGMDPEKIRVSVEGQTLTVEGERAEDLPVQEVEYHRRERSNGSFARAIRLPFEAEAGGVKAEYRAGVLSVRIPRRESTKPRSIPVSLNG